MFHQGCEPQKDLEILLQRDLNKDPKYEISFDEAEGRFLKVNIFDRERQARFLKFISCCSWDGHFSSTIGRCKLMAPL